MTRRAAWAVTLACLSVGLAGHFHGHMMYLGRMNLPPAGVQEVSPASPKVSASGRTVVVVLDGLGWDYAMARPAFAQLAERGEGRPMLTGFPSFTWPGITTIGTGLPPEVHGVRINSDDFTAPQLPSVSKQARRAGLGVYYQDRGFRPFRELLALPRDAVPLTGNVVSHTGAGVAPTDDVAAPAGVLVPDGGALVWIYLEDVDAAGHRYGAASAEYAAAVDRAEAVVAGVVRQLDFGRDTLVVLSDHGHLDRGGHGGMEPEVVRAAFLAVGPRASAGVGAPMPMTAAAPRIGALMGLAYSISWQAPEAPDPLTRAAWGIGAALLLLLGAIFSRRWIALQWRDFVPTAVYGLVFATGYVVLGYRWSWSIPRGEIGFTAETAVLALVGLGIAAVVARRDRRIPEAWAQTVVWGIPYLALAAYCGLDTRALTAPWSSWGLIVFATVVFYPGLACGMRALWTVFTMERAARASGRARGPDHADRQ